MKFLDCFCGLGGASEGFAREGFECTGIEINRKIARLYPYDCINADMTTLEGITFEGFDVIWGSPPCRDFSRMAQCGKGSVRDTKNGKRSKWAWKIPPNPQNGLKLVNAYLRFVERAKPKIWIMENVPGLQKYLDVKPQQISKITRTMKRAFWGTFPPFLMPQMGGPNLCKSKNLYHIQGPNRSWKRAKIPLACSQAFAKACFNSLLRTDKE